MGLRDEFSEAVDAIRDSQFHATRVSPVFRFDSYVFVTVEKCDHVYSLRTVWVQLTIPLRKAGNYS